MKTAEKELLKAGSVARVISKDGTCLGYAVKSNSSASYYFVTASKVAGQWHYFCTCKAGQNAFRNCKDGKCCHVKAVLEVVAIRKASEQVPPPALTLANRTGTHPVTAALAEAEASLQASTAAALDAAYAARAEEMALQAAWEEFNAVPSYLSRFKEGRAQFEDVTYCQSCGRPSRSGMCYQCYGA